MIDLLGVFLWTENHGLDHNKDLEGDYLQKKNHLVDRWNFQRNTPIQIYDENVITLKNFSR